MEFFSRFRRGLRDDDQHPEQAAPRAAILPAVNQRVTVWAQGHSLVPSRVEDETIDDIVLSHPSLALDAGDRVTLSWEDEGAWFSLDTQVTAAHPEESVPTLSVSTRGRLAQHDERRGDVRAQIALPLELRVVMARVVKGGRSLTTHTIELGSNAVRFSTSAPLAPGDMLEAKLQLQEGESVSMRLRVIRMDSVSGSWRQTCTATFDEILRSDRARIVSFLEQAHAGQSSGLRLEQLRPGD